MKIKHKLSRVSTHWKEAAMGRSQKFKQPNFAQNLVRVTQYWLISLLETDNLNTETGVVKYLSDFFSTAHPKKPITPLLYELKNAYIVHDHDEVAEHLAQLKKHLVSSQLIDCYTALNGIYAQFNDYNPDSKESHPREIIIQNTDPILTPPQAIELENELRQFEYQFINKHTTYTGAGYYATLHEKEVLNLEKQKELYILKTQEFAAIQAETKRVEAIKQRCAAEQAILNPPAEDENACPHPYMQACKTYMAHLEKVIQYEIKSNLKLTTPYRLFSALDNLAPKIEREPELITRKLIGLHRMSNETSIDLHMVETRPQFQAAWAKYKILNSLMVTLNDHSTNYLQKTASFHRILRNNKEILAKRRDTALITFIKMCGVVVAGILGAGIGGYYAHRSMFGERASHGKLFVREVSQRQLPLP